jgi:ubiquinone/menaquinone biosynthesis C-methylase UbiE
VSGEGVDISVNPKLKLIQGRVDAKLPFPNKSFDAVTALAIIEHVEHPEVMLKEIHRVLKPGGDDADHDTAPEREMDT